MSVGKKASIDDIIDQETNGSVLGVSCEVEEESFNDICETLVANFLTWINSNRNYINFTFRWLILQWTE